MAFNVFIIGLSRCLHFMIILVSQKGKHWLISLVIHITTPTSNTYVASRASFVWTGVDHHPCRMDGVWTRNIFLIVVLYHSSWSMMVSYVIIIHMHLIKVVPPMPNIWGPPTINLTSKMFGLLFTCPTHEHKIEIVKELINHMN